MKFQPSPKEARALADPIREHDLRRLIYREIDDMRAEELQRLIWKLRKAKR